MSLTFIHTIRAGIPAVLCLLMFASPVAAKSRWYKYENPYFVAYSNAPEKKALAMLDNLERFRVAFEQVSSIEVPESAPQVTVLIVRSRGEYSKLISIRNSDGFMTSADGRKFIVVPASGDMAWRNETIQHELTHVWLRYNAFDYPPWYDEGFSELMSATHFINDNQSFTVGQYTERVKRGGIRPLYEWNKLISEDFKPHAIRSASVGSSAYVQAWALAHYTFFGNGMENANKLGVYFNNIRQKMSYVDAFADAFGQSADELWQHELKEYVLHVPYFVKAFDMERLKLPFEQTPATRESYQPLLDYFATKALAGNEFKYQRKPLANIEGPWGKHAIKGSCDRPIELRIDDKHKTLELRDEVSTQQFRYTPEKHGTVLLTEISDNTRETTIKMIRRTRDLLCLQPEDHEGAGCTEVLVRCN